MNFNNENSSKVLRLPVVLSNISNFITDLCKKASVIKEDRKEIRKTICIYFTMEVIFVWSYCNFTMSYLNRT